MSEDPKTNASLDELVRKQKEWVESEAFSQKLRRVGWMTVIPLVAPVMLVCLFRFVCAPPSTLEGRLLMLLMLAFPIALSGIGLLALGGMFLERAVARYAFKRMSRRVV